MSTDPDASRGSVGAGEPTLDLRPFVRAIYGQRLWLLLGLLLGFGAGVLGWTLIGRQYEAVVTLTVNQPRGEAAVPVNPANYRALVENYSIVAVAIKNADLEQGPRAISPRDFIRKSLTVEEVRGTNLIRIHVRLHDPELAARVANDLARLAVDLNRRVSTEEGTSMRDQLKTQASEAEQRLRQTEKVLVEFEREHNLEVLKADVEGMLKQRETLAEIDSSLSGERAHEEASSREQRLRPPVLTLNRAIDTDPTMLELARDQSSGGQSPLRFGLQTEESNKVYQTVDELVIRSRARVAQLEQARKQILAASAGMAEGGRLAEYYALEIEKARLEADVALARKVYEDVAFRYEQARVVVTSGSAQLQIVDAGVPSDVPVSWPVTVWIFLGGLVGVAAAFTWICGSVATRLLRSVMAETDAV
jgi:uncharacterized protein involved in exopolysaccharide biosynthesis